MTAADAAWDALSSALERYEPPCTDLDTFTMDKLSADDQAFCATLCARCLVLPECSAYARATKPAAGFWAGRQYGTKKVTPSTTDAEAVSPATTHQQKESTS